MEYGLNKSSFEIKFSGNVACFLSANVYPVLELFKKLNLFVLDQLVDEDEWDTIFRIYDGDDWNSHDDYLSQERSARYGDEDDSQFRSWKLDQWGYRKLMKVCALIVCCSTK